MGFTEIIKRFLLTSSKAAPAHGKAAKIDAGYRKINAFIDRGIKLNPAPKREARHPKKAKLRLGQWFFRCGDAGYFKGLPGAKLRPIPYIREKSNSRYGK